jgi:hypothetical protein
MKNNEKSIRDESLLANSEKLKELADYQKGSIVSRTLIDKKTG